MKTIISFNFHSPFTQLLFPVAGSERQQLNHHVPGTQLLSHSILPVPTDPSNYFIQRIRGAIDARIAEEQARQRSAQEAASTAARPARRPSTRTATNTRQRSNSNLPQTRGPDPKEFEFSIGDDDSTGTPASGLSRAGTPRLETASNISASTTVDSAQSEGLEQTEGGEKKDAVEERKDNMEKPPELPIEVRSKLRRLDKIESKYHGRALPIFIIAHYVLTQDRASQSVQSGTCARAIDRIVRVGS